MPQEIHPVLYTKGVLFFDRLFVIFAYIMFYIGRVLKMALTIEGYCKIEERDQDLRFSSF